MISSASPSPAPRLSLQALRAEVQNPAWVFSTVEAELCDQINSDQGLSSKHKQRLTLHRNQFVERITKLAERYAEAEEEALSSFSKTECAIQHNVLIKLAAGNLILGDWHECRYLLWGAAKLSVDIAILIWNLNFEFFEQATTVRLSDFINYDFIDYGCMWFNLNSHVVMFPHNLFLYTKKENSHYFQELLNKIQKYSHLKRFTFDLLTNENENEVMPKSALEPLLNTVIYRSSMQTFALRSIPEVMHHIPAKLRQFLSEKTMTMDITLENDREMGGEIKLSTCATALLKEVMHNRRCFLHLTLDYYSDLKPALETLCSVPSSTSPVMLTLSKCSLEQEACDTIVHLLQQNRLSGLQMVSCNALSGHGRQPLIMPTIIDTLAQATELVALDLNNIAALDDEKTQTFATSLTHLTGLRKLACPALDAKPTACADLLDVIFNHPELKELTSLHLAKGLAEIVSTQLRSNTRLTSLSVCFKHMSYSLEDELDGKPDEAKETIQAMTEVLNENKTDHFLFNILLRNISITLPSAFNVSFIASILYLMDLLKDNRTLGCLRINRMPKPNWDWNSRTCCPDFLFNAVKEITAEKTRCQTQILPADFADEKCSQQVGEHNARCQRQRASWAGASVATGFVRANRDSPVRFSIVPLLPRISRYAGLTREETIPISLFMGSLFFTNHTQPRRHKRKQPNHDFIHSSCLAKPN